MQGLLEKLSNSNSIDLSMATAGDGNTVQGKYRVDFDLQLGFIKDQLTDERTKREVA